MPVLCLIRQQPACKRWLSGRAVRISCCIYQPRMLGFYLDALQEASWRRLHLSLHQWLYLAYGCHQQPKVVKKVHVPMQCLWCQHDVGYQPGGALHQRRLPRGHAADGGAAVPAGRPRLPTPGLRAHAGAGLPGFPRPLRRRHCLCHGERFASACMLELGYRNSPDPFAVAIVFVIIGMLSCEDVLTLGGNPNDRFRNVLTATTGGFAIDYFARQVSCVKLSVHRSSAARKSGPSAHLWCQSEHGMHVAVPSIMPKAESTKFE